MTSRAYSGIVSPEATTDLFKVGEALRGYGPEAQKRFQSAGAQQLNTAWPDELAKRPSYNRVQRDIVTASPAVAVAAVSGGVGIIAATGGRGKLAHLTRAWEFGTLNQNAVGQSRYPSRRGRPQRPGTYSRRTKRQVPTRSQTGWIAYSAAGAWSERVYKMLLEIVVLVGHNAFEGKSGNE